MRRNFSKSLFSASLAATLLFSAGCAVKRPSGEVKPWGTYLLDSGRSNYSTDEVLMPLVLSWKDDLSDFQILRGSPKEQLSSPVISNGVLYVGSTDNRFYSFDLMKGKGLWKYNAKYPVEAPATVLGNNVCFGSSNGVLRCFDSASKEARPLWEFQAKSEILSSPVITPSGEVYFSSSDDRVYALRLSNGGKLWSYARGTFQTVAPRLYASPAYSEGRLYALFSDGYLVCLDAGNGKEVWTRKIVKSFDAAQRTRRTPMVDNGRVYIIDDNNSIAALDQQTGETRNIYNVIKANDFIIASKMVLAAGAGEVASFDKLTGSVNWKKQITGGTVSTVIGAGEYLFVISNYTHTTLGIDFLSKTKGRIEALGIRDGAPVWSAELGSGVSSSSASTEYRVALLTDKGLLKVFAPK